LPPLAFRAYSLAYPARAGRWLLNSPARNDWWVAHQLQMLYAAIPVFESILRLVPGLYSAWLRLWGSKIGKRVYWTALVEIIDRHMLRVGDDVLFGHRVVCSSHVIIKKRNGDFMLILRPARIGSGTFVGAFARIGPGVKIPEATIIPYNAEHRFTYAE
jgi:acetyltransferase-like isoleucine patch superfamily enzyme